MGTREVTATFLTDQGKKTEMKPSLKMSEPPSACCGLEQGQIDCAGGLWIFEENQQNFLDPGLLTEKQCLMALAFQRGVLRSAASASPASSSETQNPRL
jgi:hypothetical protein